MSVKTPCQTDGATYGITVEGDSVMAFVEFGRDLMLSAEEANLLERNVHNALELVLAKYWATGPGDQPAITE
jgi:hypothetical protein